jgi:hypothetical protein
MRSFVRLREATWSLCSVAQVEENRQRQKKDAGILPHSTDGAEAEDAS